MERDKVKELQRKIVEALKVSSIKLIEDKKKTNGELVVYRDGEIKIIKASTL